MVRQFKKKICLIGDGEVGKTSLIRKFVTDQFDDEYIMTIGTKITTREVPLSVAGEHFEVHLMIWDVLGQAQYQRLKTQAYSGATGALIVGDITREDTIRNMAGWTRTFRSTVGDVPVIFLANKADLIDEEDGWIRALKEEAGKLGITFLFTSAKTGLNVEKAFALISRAVLLSSGDERLPPPEPMAPVRVKMGPLQLLDRIIDEFCMRNGGYEEAMPIVEEIVRGAGIDFRNPSKADVSVVYKQLLDREKADADVDAVDHEDEGDERLSPSEVLAPFPTDDPGIEIGSNYLILEDKVDKAYTMLRKIHDSGVKVMFITQSFPNKIVPKHGLDGIEVYWVTDSHDGKGILKPGRLEFEMSQRVFGFLHEADERVVMLDCIELLVMENGFQKVMKFLKKINDHAAVALSSHIVVVSPRGVDDSQLLMLEKEFDELRDLREK